MMSTVLKTMGSLTPALAVPIHALPVPGMPAVKSLNFSELIDFAEEDAIQSAVIAAPIMTIDEPGKIMPGSASQITQSGNDLPVLELPALELQPSAPAQDTALPSPQSPPSLANAPLNPRTPAAPLNDTATPQLSQRPDQAGKPPSAQASQTPPAVIQQISQAMEALDGRSPGSEPREPATISRTSPGSATHLDTRLDQSALPPAPKTASAVHTGAIEPLPLHAQTTSSMPATSTPQPAQPETAPQPQRPLEALIDNLAEARESGRTARGEVQLRHAEFGMVALRIEQGDRDLSAKLMSRDPAFAAAAQFALSERAAVAATADTSASHQRGHEQSGTAGNPREGTLANGGERNGHSRDQETPRDPRDPRDLNRANAPQFVNGANHNAPVGSTQERGRFA